MADGVRPRELLGAGVLCIAAFLALCALASFEEKRPSPVAAYFSAALRDARAVEYPVIGGARYEVRRGEVRRDGRPVDDPAAEAEALKAGYALALARRAPLLALDGVELSEFERNIGALSSLAHSLADSQATSAESEMVARGLFPLEFLEQLRQLEERRRSFLQAGTGESAAAYDEALNGTLQTYRRNLQEFEDAFRMAVPEDVPEYQILKGIVSRESFIASIERLKHGVASLQKSVERRQRCLHGGIISCDSQDIRLAVSAQKESASPPSAHPPTADIFSLYAGASLGLQKPAVMLSGSACVPPSLAPPLYTVRQAQDDLLLFVGDAFFVDTARGATAPFYRFFRDIGLPYWLYQPASTYACPSIAEEYGRVWSAYEIRAASRQLPLSPYASGNERARLAELEEKLASGGNAVQESDAREYAAAAARWAAGSAEVPLEALRHAESLARTLVTPGSGLSGSVQHLVRELSSNSGLAEAGVPVAMDMRNLFYLRSGYFALFLGGTSAQPDAAGPAAPARSAELPLERFAELRSEVPLDSLAGYAAYFFAIHERPAAITELNP